MQKRTYLDWNATSPVRPEAREAYMKALEVFGNPSSIHAEGRAARNLVEESREEVAQFMGCDPDEVVFTGGGFEANNIALHSLSQGATRVDFTAAKIEHGSVLGPLNALVDAGWNANWMPVSAQGVADVDAITGKEWFACLQAGNQEVGALQNLEKMTQICGGYTLPWHCDAVQAWGRTPLSASRYGFATASLAGHKLGAPKGTGALFVRKGIPVTPIFLSGPQEKSRRPGTENVPGISALAAACKAARLGLLDYNLKCRVLREELVKTILHLNPKAVINGPADPSILVLNTLSVSMPGVEGSTLVQAMDLEGVAISSGSACASGAAKPSGVLTAMGVPEELARCTVRISLGWGSSEEDVARFGAALKTVLCRINPKAFCDT